MKLQRISNLLKNKLQSVWSWEDDESFGEDIEDCDDYQDCVDNVLKEIDTALNSVYLKDDDVVSQDIYQARYSRESSERSSHIYKRTSKATHQTPDHIFTLF